MKSIGILGGMSWESTLEYYRILNQLVKERLGGMHSARIVMISVDFAPIEAAMQAERWDDVAGHLCRSARLVEDGGADLMLIATNTMHYLFDQVAGVVSIPLIHIADATGDEIRRQNLGKVGLLGTIFTMEKEFYRGRLAGKYGLEVIVPESKQRQEINRIVFEELVAGTFTQKSKDYYLEVIGSLIQQGAEGVILGCTEIPMLVQQSDVNVPIFDTTYLHAKVAVDMSLA